MAVPDTPSAQARQFAPLEMLPDIVLRLVSSVLSDARDDKRDLLAFSFVSRRCAEVSRRDRLQRIHLHLQHKDRLLDDLNRLTWMLGRNERFYFHVHQLKLTGCLLGTKKQMVPRTGESPSWNYVAEDNSYHMGGIPTSNKELLDFDPFLPRPNEEEKSQIEDAWSPLAHFIGTLPRLQDLLYACHNQVPRCLLLALHQNTPNTRLHVQTFSLRSLYQRPGQGRNIDQDEYLLASSPSLHSVVAKLYRDPSLLMVGDINYNHEAVMRMAAGVAPNLKSAKLWPWSRYEKPWMEYLSEPSLPPWKGFHGEEAPSAKGNIECLEAHIKHFNRWSQHTSLEKLHTLKIRGKVSTTQLARLVTLRHEFKSLQSLRLNTNSLRHEERLDRDLGVLFLDLLPLTDLSVGGYVSEAVLGHILHHHGPTLKQLKLMPEPRAIGSNLETKVMVVSPSHLKEIGQRCPLLEQLEVFVQRTQGDHREVSFYRALGQMRRLKRLSIIFDCSIRNTLSPMGDEEGVPCWIGLTAVSRYYRKALRNCAVDPVLARSIYKEISRDSGSLEYLKVQVERFDPLQFPDAAGAAMMDFVSRGWICERDDRGVGCMIPDTNISWDSLRTIFRERPDLESIWTDVWPRTSDGRLQWSSFPLQLSAQVEQ